MTSQIDPTLPVFGTPTTASVRQNFATAASEISALQTGLVADAPQDGRVYGRGGGAWISLAPPPSLTVAAGPSLVVPPGTMRVFVTTMAAVSLTLPPNDCLVLDRTGNRTNPITLLPPGAATINGLIAYTLVNPWATANLVFDGANYGLA